jgi:hypothetical protein
MGVAHAGQELDPVVPANARTGGSLFTSRLNATTTLLSVNRPMRREAAERWHRANIPTTLANCLKHKDYLAGCLRNPIGYFAY